MATHLQLGNELFVRKQYEEALAAFLRHACDEPSQAADAYSRAAKCCLSMNRLETPREVMPGVHLVFESNRQGAEHFYRKALEHDPQHYESLLGLAGILPEGSEERFQLMETAVASQPHYLTLIKIGDYYRTIKGDLVAAYENYQKAQHCRPRDKMAYQKLSDICRRLGRTREAEEWMAKWHEVDKTRRKVGPARDTG